MLHSPKYFAKLPTIKEVIQIYKLSPDKKLGQNFLQDSFITDQIVSACGNLQNATILEVGPGPGGLTRSILSANPKRVFAVEMDKRCIAAVSQIAELSEGVLSVHEGDAVTFDETTLTEDKIFIISNLPYNIGTKLLFKWMDNIHLFSGIVVMLQKEVVDRIVASPSSKDYGRLSVILQILFDVDKVIDVEPEFFFPPPKVTSSVVRLIPKEKPAFEFNKANLEKILDAGFIQRRKMIRSSLSKYFSLEDFAKLNIEPTKRIEDLSVENLCLLSLNLRNS